MRRIKIGIELANEFYGITIALVESILKMQDITQLPRTPSFVKGAPTCASVFRKGIVRLENRLIIFLGFGKVPDLNEQQTLEALFV